MIIFYPVPRRSTLFLSLICAPLLLSSCHEERITVQEVPKGIETIITTTPAPPAAAPPAQPAPEGDALRIWSLPAGWREIPTTAPMRLATLVYEDESSSVEVAITSFPGDVGGDLANVNRWRGQMGLSPIDEAELEEALERFTNDSLSGYFLRIDGTNASMLAAGLYSNEMDQSWFVRVTTDPETASRVEDEVKSFAESFGTHKEEAE